jgi:hypothetical protein
MTSNHLGRVAALAFALALAIGACSGPPGGGSTNDPTSTVQSALTAMSTGGIGKVSDFVCAAKKGDLLSAFGGSASLSALTQAGVKTEDLFAAISMSVANVAVTEKTKTDTTATVHVTGDQTITLDKDKMREIFKTVLTAQGKPADDATLNAVMAAMSSQMTQSQKLDEDLSLVNEGGKWLIC